MRLFLIVLLVAVPLQAESIDVPGGKLWYEVRGEGLPLILLHDGLVSSGTWDDQMPAFARLFRTVRYDRRGYGRSEAAKQAFSDVDDLHAVLDSLKIDRAVLVGCSNGAKLAVDYTLAHPERVGSLVLVGPVVSGLPYSEHFQRRGLENFRPMFRDKNADGLIEAWVQDRYILGPDSTRARERLRELLKGSPNPLINRGIESRAPESPAVGRLSEVKVPALILVGESDIPDVHAHAGALEAGIQGSRRVVIPGAGHLIHLEKPDLFNETVLTFLRPDDAAAAYLRSLRPVEEKSDYDASAPLDVQVVKTEGRVIDLSYASPLGGRVPAFLVLPEGEGKHPAAVFQRDEFITPWDAEVYVQAASAPKEVKWYDTDHFFDDQARQDRMEWLAHALGL